MGDARTNWRRIALNETMNMKGECHKREEKERERVICVLLAAMGRTARNRLLLVFHGSRKAPPGWRENTHIMEPSRTTKTTTGRIQRYEQVDCIGRDYMADGGMLKQGFATLIFDVQVRVEMLSSEIT